MTTNRYRAGQPADLSLQLHRVQDMPIDFAGPEPTHVETASVEDVSPDVLSVLGWVVCVILVLFIVAVFAGYWSMK